MTTLNMKVGVPDDDSPSTLVVARNSGQGEQGTASG